MRSCLQWIWAAGLVLAPAVLNAGQSPSSNQRMADQIAQQLEAKGDFSGCRIMIEYTGGTATLKGTVHTPQQRQQALQLTGGVRGVEQVQDGLSVLPASTRYHTPTVALPPAPIQRVAATPQLPQAAPRVAARGYYLQEEAVPAPIPGQQFAAAPSYAAAAAAPVRYDLPHFPPYAWPSYSSYPNYASLTYPQQYSATAWPYIGPFYPYPQVPLGWRKVSLEWDDGWWFVEFDD